MEIFFLLFFIFHQAACITSPQSVKLPNINVQSLGSMGLVGQYDTISRYSYTGQQNASTQPSNLDNLIYQSSSNQFLVLNSTNGIVSSICTLGQDTIYFAGNFTKIGNNDFQSGLARLNITSGEISSPKSQSGSPNGSSIRTLYCDQQDEIIYVGGDFTFQNSTGVALWSPNNSTWLTPLFGGFKSSSVVNSIVAHNNNLIFGGSFSSLANSSIQSTLSTNSTTSNVTVRDYTQQLLPFSGATITAEGTDSSSSASSIACPGTSSAAWKLTDNRQGTWTASWPLSFVPTKLRLYNLKDSNDGTKTFRFIAFPINGIMNFTYTDPETNEPRVCDAYCPLPQSSTKEYVDFEFINPVSMDSFQIYVTDYYGSAAGLSGVEITQSNLNVYANNSLNSGLSCQNLQYESSSSTSGSGWNSVTASGSTYESISITDASQLSDISVTLKPAVPSKGNFSLHLFTPGCTDDNSCSQRGQVNVTVFPTRDQSSAVSTVLYQTNDYEKYDSIYNGSVDPSQEFTPYVIIQPITGQPVPLTFVVDRLQYIFTGGAENTTNSSTTANVDLNGLFEYSISNFTKYAANSSFSPVGNSTINLAGNSLGDDAVLTGLASLDTDNLLIAGKFSSDFGSNLAIIDNFSLKSISGNGTNGEVTLVQSLGNGVVAVAGSFSKSGDNKTDLPGLGIYNNTASNWPSLGSGISGGDVVNISPFNLDANTSSVAISGNFTSINGTNVKGFGVWVADENKWLESSSLSDLFLQGHISEGASLNNSDFYFGSLQTASGIAPGAVYLDSNFDTNPMPFEFTSSNSSASNSSLSKRAGNISVQSVEGNIINCGVFANSSLSILGGRFTGKNSKSGESFRNVAIVDQAAGNAKGLPSSVFGENSTVYTLLVNDDKLFVGGFFNAEINSSDSSALLFYDLNEDQFSSTQPPGLFGGDQLVTSLNMRPDTNQLVVMGSFEQAGSLGCESFCIYDLDASRWNSPSGGLSGLISSATFIGSDIIFFAGDLTLNSTKNVYFAQYNFQNSFYQGYEDMSKALPGPVNSFVLNGNGIESIFVSGTDLSNNEVYLAHWNQTSWTRIDSVFESHSVVTGLTLLELGSNHDANNILPQNELLMVTGSIGLKGFGNASSVLYDGNNWQPLFLATSGTGTGTVNAFFSQSTQSFSTLVGKKHMKRGFVVLISLAIAIGLMFLLVLLGLVVTYVRRRRQGYMPAPRVSEAEMTDTVPPSTLIRGLDRGQQI